MLSACQHMVQSTGRPIAAFQQQLSPLQGDGGQLLGELHAVKVLALSIWETALVTVYPDDIKQLASLLLMTPQETSSNAHNAGCRR